jgi:Squalene/phytoene synthase
MSTIEHLYAPALDYPSRNAALDNGDNRNNAIALRRNAAGRSLFSAMQLLPGRRRRAMRALYAFYREVNDIADGDASRSLKQILLANWRSEIGLLFAGRPQHDVTHELSETVHLYGLRCDDFLAIIDGMDARTDIRAPSLAELDRYCERMAVAIARISLRIFGETSPASQRVAAELGRALQLTEYFAISPAMPACIGFTCRASCCTRMAYLQQRRAGCWRSRRSPKSAAISPCSPSGIMQLPSRQSLLALAGQCARRRRCSVFIAPFSTSSSRAAGASLTNQYEYRSGANWPS